MTVNVTRAILADLTPAEAAALWQVRRDGGSPFDANLFEEWLAADEAHRAAWERLDSAWSLFGDADDPLFAAMRSEALAAGPIEEARSFRRNWKYALAACLALGLIGSGVLLLVRDDPLSQRTAQFAGRNETGGERYAAEDTDRTFALADGSEMALTKGSTARVDFAAGERRIVLERGQARFKVRHDRAHRFSVIAGQWSIVDYGTRFEVGIEGDGLRVALFEGAVQVEGNDRPPTMLSPGKQLVARAGLPDRISNIDDDGNGVSAGNNGFAEFEDATLTEAVTRFNAVNTVQLVIADQRAAALHITGQFRLNDPARFAETIAQFLPVRVSRPEAGTIMIASRRK